MAGHPADETTPEGERHPSVMALQLWMGGLPKPRPFPDLYRTIEAEIVSLDQARRLASELRQGIDEIDADELQWAINAAGSTYRLNRWGHAISRPKSARDQIEEVLRAVDTAITTLDETDYYVRLRLAVVDDPGDPSRDAAACRRYLEGLQAAAVKELAKMPRGDSKPGLDHLRELCRWLANIYEDRSGKRFTYDAHGKPPAFLSEGARWVAKVARLVDPSATDANLATAMRALPRKLNHLQMPSRNRS